MLKVHLEAENASTGLLVPVFYGGGGPGAESRVSGGRVGAVPHPQADPMSEDERLEMLRTATEAHADLKELALRLRRRLTLKSPATKAAFKAEQEVFRLRRELQRLELSGPDPAERRGPLPEVSRGGKVIDIGRLRWGKDPDEET